MLAAGAVSAQDLKIYGHMTTSDSFDFPPTGIYSFHPKAGTAVTLEFSNPDWFASGGCVYIDGKYYDVNRDDHKINVYDTKAAPWNAVQSVPFSGFNGATDLTYDVTTETVYGCFILGDGKLDDNTYCFGTLDLATGTMKKIADLKQYYPAIAADKTGTIYAVGADMGLYRIDKTSGKVVKIGATGLDALEHWTPQSAEFDLATNTLYYCYNTLTASIVANNTYLYTIDTATGTATRVMQFPQNETFVDIYIPSASSSADAPAKAESLKAVFNDGKGDGTVSFTVPTKTIDGKALSGDVDYTISVAGTALATGTAKPGETVSKAVSSSASGEVTVAVSLSNASGKTSTTETKVFIGVDTPLAVSGLKLVTEDNTTVKLTWNAPTQGVHNGFIDPTSLTYGVRRMPEGKVVATGLKATSFSEKLAPEQVTSVYYEVVPSNSAASGAAAQSNRVNVGQANKVPYDEAFDSDDRFAAFTVVDGFNDGATWSRYTSKNDGSTYAVCNYSSTNPKDEWLITPAVELKKNYKYVLRFKAMSVYVSKPEKLEVAYGQGNTAKAMTTTVMEPSVVNNKLSRQWKDYSFAIDNSESGNFNFGFHAVSDADMFNLRLSDLHIEGAAFTAPAQADGLKAVSDAGGALTADVSFTVPTKTVEGKTLDSVDKVEILCGGELKKTVSNPAPGTSIKENISVGEGDNTVEVVVYNQSGASIPATTTVYAGADIPGTTSVKVSVADGKQHITWEAPKGYHGGYADPSNTSYTVYRFVGEDQATLATDTLSLDCYDNYTAESQAVVTYAVVPRNDLGYGTYSASQPVVIGGTPYTLPFLESFDQGFNKYPVWSMVSRTGMGSWVIYDKDKTTGMPLPYDNDGGYIFFSKNDKGDRCQLFSGNIALGDAENPVLDLWYYQKKSSNKLVLQACAESGEWEDLKTVSYDNDQPEGWTKVSVPLSKFKSASYLQIGFEATANDDAPIAVDRIGVSDARTNDLAVSLAGKKHFFYDDDNILTATVTNLGTATAQNSTVRFLRNGSTIATYKVKAVAPGEAAEVRHNVTLGLDAADNDSYTAEVDFSDDEFTANNTSETLDVANSLPKYPVATALKATASGSNVALSWTAPAEYVAPELEPVTESFEDYTPFTIDDLGEWTLKDVDGEDGTFAILPLAYPYRESAKSFQVFSADYLSMRSDGDYEVWAAHTGKQMLMAFADKDRLNDDWLISPVLSGKKQTVSFWVRTISGNYPNETYSVMASSTGKNVGDFTEIASGEAPLDWTEIQAELPEGTKYFAIRCTSADCYLMVLDDVTYTPGTGLPENFSLTGYNVYRDGVKITSSPVSATSFADNIGSDKGHSYAVTAVYTTGESRFSNVVTVGEVTAVDGVDTFKASVTAQYGTIFISHAEGQPIAVADATGKSVYSANAAAANVAVPVAPGLYIVKVGKTAMKIVVK